MIAKLEAENQQVGRIEVYRVHNSVQKCMIFKNGNRNAFLVEDNAIKINELGIFNLYSRFVLNEQVIKNLNNNNSYSVFIVICV